ncbi:MAG: DUF3987 domain-containing protein [Chitinophagaceae bacterium]|nr:DUF3987 domain-containing protein [Chitinophagaceae bacterium]
MSTKINLLSEIIGASDEFNAAQSNDFPVDVLPPIFKTFVDETHHSLNFPPDYTGTAIICALATTIGRSCKLKVKDGWDEYPSFFFSLIGNAGSNKSHPLEEAFKPLIEFDSEIIRAYQKDFAEFEGFFQLSKNDREGLPAPPKPTLRKTILHNFTGEILHQRLADNERGCVVVSEELATFLEGMNNYSKGDQTSVYLSFWSNKPTSIDRVSKPVPLWLPSPFLNIIGTLQPRILLKLFPSGKTNNGFLQRFLFAFPDQAEKHAINDYQINSSVLDSYRIWLNDFRANNPININPETGHQQPKVYQWSRDAKDFFYEWQKLNTEKVNENAESLKGEVISKFDIHFIRLALVLQIMSDYSGSEIELDAVHGAAQLCNYYERCALKVLDVLEKGRNGSITKKDLIKILSGFGASQNEIAAALKVSQPYVNKILKNR